ncbi:lecithin retinol acyltransferase family protein [Siniperca chuatsi]|uniref:lecithin retinol acyltransferase family protein n=1 Tax=Siniperca chuatsi TaxID=119488 RepID=UPI001CE0F42F|nr:lecithin retinol acyltransferase family protein [Siniperca chuatsi]
MFLYQLFNFFFVASKKEEDSKYDLSLYKHGDLLEVPRTLFTHFGIYLGDNRVAHLIPDILPMISKNKSAIAKMVTNNRLLLGVITKVASVRVDSVADFAYGSEILVNHMDKVCSQPPLDGYEVARRAEKLQGSVTYSLLWYNCEHYVMYCRYGMAISYQTYQFCTTVRKIVCSRMSSCLTALCGVGAMLYLGCATPLTVSSTLLISFTIWMAA